MARVVLVIRYRIGQLFLKGGMVPMDSGTMLKLPL